MQAHTIPHSVRLDHDRVRGFGGSLKTLVYLNQIPTKSIASRSRLTSHTSTHFAAVLIRIGIRLLLSLHQFHQFSSIPPTDHRSVCSCSVFDPVCYFIRVDRDPCNVKVALFVSIILFTLPIPDLCEQGLSNILQI